MQMLVVFTGKTFGLQVVELSKPFLIRKVKICIELCKLQNVVKRVATAPIKLVTAPVRIVQNAIHATADTLHPGEQEEGCVLTYMCLRSKSTASLRAMQLSRALTCGLVCDVHCMFHLQ
eukprot:COSAG02_NODE_34718_length_479_cov_1.310526_1_plen_119_part_00